MRLKIFLLSCSFLLWLGAGHVPHPVHQGCTFTALDIGQGDSLFIRTSDGQDILIDGGPDDTVVQKLSRALPPGDRDLELVVLTHPHADHVNGLVAVTQRFVVRQVLLTELKFRQGAYAAWLDQLNRQHVPEHVAVAGQRYHVGTATLDVLWPGRDLSHDTIDHDNAANGGGVNDSSIVLRLACDGSRAMLMGDASTDIEDRILDSGANVRADLLKVGHHGSRFSSGPRFLAAVQPVWAVISVGLHNHYHHPHPTAVLHLQRIGAKILRTDQDGNITLETDGRGHWRTQGDSNPRSSP